MKQQITTFLVGGLLVFALFSAASLKQLSPNALPTSRGATADPGVKAVREANVAVREVKLP